MSLERHEITSLLEAQQRAYRRGQQAYLEEKPCEPSKDDEAVNLAFSLSIEDGAKVMAKWRDGWLYNAKHVAMGG